ncbi:hypothetical protein AB0N09_42845 [Streptomyces erythrochromogenes]|uniref:hypothetical protein n=1 Tax=Streptomyces erythrochromogenes TaxID=285574 RepID=UPI00342C26C2
MEPNLTTLPQNFPFSEAMKDDAWCNSVLGAEFIEYLQGIDHTNLAACAETDVNLGTLYRRYCWELMQFYVSGALAESEFMELPLAENDGSPTVHSVMGMVEDDPQVLYSLFREACIERFHELSAGSWKAHSNGEEEHWTNLRGEVEECRNVAAASESEFALIMQVKRRKALVSLQNDYVKNRTAIPDFAVELFDDCADQLNTAREAYTRTATEDLKKRYGAGSYADLTALASAQGWKSAAARKEGEEKQPKKWEDNLPTAVSIEPGTFGRRYFKRDGEIFIEHKGFGQGVRQEQSLHLVDGEVLRLIKLPFTRERRDDLDIVEARDAVAKIMHKKGTGKLKWVLIGEDLFLFENGMKSNPYRNGIESSFFADRLAGGAPYGEMNISERAVSMTGVPSDKVDVVRAAIPGSFKKLIFKEKGQSPPSKGSGLRSPYLPHEEL